MMRRGAQTWSRGFGIRVYTRMESPSMEGSRPAKLCAESLWPVWASWVRIPLPAPIMTEVINNVELVGKSNLLKNSHDF